MNIKNINISTEFSRFPGGRVRTDGPYSGEIFREDILIPALNSYEQVVLTIDEVMGYGSSFLEECFGGLVRKGFNKEDLKKKLKIQYKDSAFEMYDKEIWEYINQQ